MDTQGVEREQPVWLVHEGTVDDVIVHPLGIQHQHCPLGIWTEPGREWAQPISLTLEITT